jgi:hypothetical protein
LNVTQPPAKADARQLNGISKVAMIDVMRRTHRTKVLDCYLFDSLQEVLT